MFSIQPTWWETLAVACLVVGIGLVGGLRLPRFVRALYRTERRALLTVGLISFAVAAMCTAIRPQPPSIHDEFSYLMAADTFARGRLTNPTHPLWRHFETFHVLQHPTRQSKYPPAQALFLAAGQVLTGRPIVGVWISLSLACMALYWCLCGWVPRRWAFYGGLLPCFRFGSWMHASTYDWAYWATTYWGGAAALLGASLVLGATVRLIRGKDTWLASALFGLGLGVLATSRPLEGLTLAVPVSLLLAAVLLRRGGVRLLFQRLIPAAAVCVVLLSALGYYHWRITGSPFTMPYHVYTEGYDVVPVFRYQADRPEPEYLHDVVRRYHTGFMVGIASRQRRGLGVEVSDVLYLASFLLGYPLAAAAFLGILYWRDRWRVWLLVLLCIGSVGHSVTLISPFRAHYFAPFVPVVVLIAIQGLRVIWAWRLNGRRTGEWIVQGILVAGLAVFVVGAVIRASLPAEKLEPFPFYRQAIVQQLESLADEQLVIVRYQPDHNVFQEWVYNRADIDASKVVWAREMTAAENSELLNYFGERSAWLLEADASPPRLTPYPTTVRD